MIAYRVVNKINGKSYIGITRRTLTARWKEHVVGANKASASALSLAIRKHGKENFLVEHIASAQSESELLDLERILILQHNSIVGSGRGYNLTPGGEGVVGPRSQAFREMRRKMQTGKKFSLTSIELLRQSIKVAWLMRTPTQRAEIGAKISAANIGRIMDAEWRANIGNSSRGRRQSPETIQKLKARIVSVETRALMSAAKIGKKQSGEHVAKVRAANIGKKRSEEARLRMRISRAKVVMTAEWCANISAGNKGHFVSAETRAKISATKLARNKAKRDALT